MKTDNEVNVAEILKEYATPGQLLYTGHGAVAYKNYDEERQRIVVTEVYMGYGREYDNFGHATTWNGGVDNIVSLFPSRHMRNWEMFALKPGDVLSGARGEGIGIMAVFGGWTDNTYTRFKSPCFLYNDCTFGEGDTFAVADFDKVADCVRKRFYETLKAHYHERFDPVTGTLHKSKKQHQFKPFDKVLVRDEEEETWSAQLFSCIYEKSDTPYECMGDAYRYCIPYEGNEHLLGTTNNPD